MHRPIVSLMEELEAIDWYQQRADACADPQLKDVLLYNKNEEIEHATMVMEWVRRHNDHFDQMMRKYQTGGPWLAPEQRKYLDECQE
jgi:hypothetical protein